MVFLRLKQIVLVIFRIIFSITFLVIFLIIFLTIFLPPILTILLTIILPPTPSLGPQTPSARNHASTSVWPQLGA